MSARLHRPAPDETGDVGRSACGRPAVLLAVDGAQVTCSACARVRVDAPRGIGWHEALLGIAHLLGGPPVVPAPLLTREVWRAMDCRRGELVESADAVHLDPRRMTPRAWSDAGRPVHAMRCGCPVCAAEEASLGASANWEAEQQIRPHRNYECEYGSVDAMMADLARHVLDGVSVHGNTGSIMARLEESERLGGGIQTTQRFDRDPLPVRRVQRAVDAGRFVRRAFAEEQERRGLPLETCVAIFVSRFVNHPPKLPALSEDLGVSAEALRKLIGHARRVVTIEAAAARYIPMPRDVDGLGPHIERRMAEVGER